MKPARTCFVLSAALTIFVACGDDKGGGGRDPAEDATTPLTDTGGGEITDVVGFDTAPPVDTSTESDASGGGGEVREGEFGAACQANADCVSGFCVEGPEGFMCTKGCQLECPTGYDCRGVQSGSADPTFLCLPRVARVCVPCRADYQCPNGACLEIGASTQCSFGCESNDDCPPSYLCEADAAGTHAGKFCQPRSGSCDCTPELAGAVRTCTNENAFGTCYGVESCDAAAGWVGCNATTAIAEVCDGRDNNCNALVDEGVETNTPCENTNAFGTCRGVNVCVGTQGLVCTAATPEAESCDFRDNDCDGQIDEDFKDANGEFTLSEHCGTCNSDCSQKIANGTGTCEMAQGASPVCVVAACNPDYVELNRFQCALPPDVSCLPCASENECYDGSCVQLDGQSVCVVPCGDSGSCQAGYTCRDVAGEERCVPTSGSCLCNPQTDGQIRTCVRSSVSGTCYGQETCVAASGWAGCSARIPAEETCNGVDDDCSAGIDDVIGRGNACTNANSFGSCPGVRDCVTGQSGLACVGSTPSAEICNYEDDDCDGRTDEGFEDLYVSCSNGRGACQRFGFRECNDAGTATECNAVAGAPSVEVCDRLDNDCNGQTDETFPGIGEVCYAGVGACRAAGTQECNAAGTGVACGAVPGAVQSEACDLLDNDCDGVTDNGFKDTSGKYAADNACGNCFTDCTVILARPNARGVCNAVATPICDLSCNAGYFNLNDVPDDGCEFALDNGAIYVGTDSVGAVDDASCGLGPNRTGAGHHPCATITYGLGRVIATGRSKVIVADGLYTEQVVLLNGVSVLGGYRADTWERHLSSTGTTVRGPDGTGDRKAIVAIDITANTIVEGLVVNAANAISTGANSYAIYVRNSTGALNVRNNLIFAGLGGPGANGTAGASGENGVKGSNGIATKHISSCSGTPSTGGNGGAKTACVTPGTTTEVEVSGGKGGNAVCPNVDKQEGSGVGGKNSGGSGGAGGWGHTYSPSCRPTAEEVEVGGPGGDSATDLGRDGSRGLGCSASGGSVSGNEWRGTSGADAGHGAHGAGGGGGGAGSGAKISDSSYDIAGTGGGGGSGGCAGTRGGGGAAGGGSFGVFLLWLDGGKPTTAAGVPLIMDNVISRNQGGPGGAGGNGGAGGDPGAGGAGGLLDKDVITAPPYCVFGGAKGGFGSRGGHGGGGGGACGGASFDIFAWGINGQANTFDDNIFASGSDVTGGQQGAGGNSSNTTKAGTAGQRGASGTINVVN